MSLVKTIGSEPDVTEICTNSTQNLITLIVCKIRTERNMSAECRLLYQYGKGFEHQCDSRFKLIQENQTVFLQLDGLTPVDSGNYSCECSTPDGTIILNLNITVEGKHTFMYFYFDWWVRWLFSAMLHLHCVITCTLQSFIDSLIKKCFWLLNGFFYICFAYSGSTVLHVTMTADCFLHK